MMERRRNDIACVQETKWKGAKAREIAEGYKLYCGKTNKINGVGIIVKRQLQSNIIERTNPTDYDKTGLYRGKDKRRNRLIFREH